jgi:hypothetical protein
MESTERSRDRRPDAAEGDEGLSRRTEEPQIAESGMDIEPEQNWAYERTRDQDASPDEGSPIHPPA